MRGALKGFFFYTTTYVPYTRGLSNQLSGVLKELDGGVTKGGREKSSQVTRFFLSFRFKDHEGEGEAFKKQSKEIKEIQKIKRNKEEKKKRAGHF